MREVAERLAEAISSRDDCLQAVAGCVDLTEAQRLWRRAGTYNKLARSFLQPTTLDAREDGFLAALWS